VTLADDGYRSLGLTGYRLEITSLGDATCRPRYRERLVAHLAGLDLDDAMRRRAELNPLRVLDDKRPEVQRLLASAPLMLDHLCSSCAEHFDAVQRLLDGLGVRYVINPRMVRGLDYYTRTTFEFVHDGLGAQSGIGGGGRYDGLMESIGGPALTGIGYGLGVDRTLLACQVEGLVPIGGDGLQVFVVPLGDAARVVAVDLVHRARRGGLAADMSYGDRGLKGAMKAAGRSGARWAVILGDRDLEHGVVQLKDLGSGDQQAVPLDNVVATVASALGP
jgi:histidyl-tRNA synthetase